LKVPRTVVYRHMGGSIANQCGQPVETFLENCTNIGGNPDFCVKGQQVWGRGLNNETVRGANFVCDGGTLWVFNFKTENKPYPSFVVKNGGRLEVLGGYANAVTPTAKDSPMIIVENSQASVTMFTDNWTVFGDIVETRGGEKRTVSATAFPRRKTTRRDLLFVPLYVAGKP
jgi:hypothetical protein